MDSALEQLRSLATQADSTGQHEVLDALRDLQRQLETPHDTLSRFSGLVSMLSFYTHDLAYPIISTSKSRLLVLEPISAFSRSCRRMENL
jgi:hypothetical protein